MSPHYEKSFGSNPAENYEKYFVPSIGAPVAAGLIQAAALKSGERVLDIGCGTGVVTRLAAEETRTTVTGLDVNPAMLDVARSCVPAGISIEWHEASAEKLPLPDAAFDVVLCQMSLQFVSDKEAALGEMHRVLAPEGRLVLNTPGEMQPLFSAMEAALARHLSPEAAGFLKAVFSMHDPVEMNELLLGAGFRDIDVKMTTVSLRLPPAGQFLWQYLYSTPLAQAVQQLDDSRRDALEQDVTENEASLVKEGKMTGSQGIVLGTARK